MTAFGDLDVDTAFVNRIVDSAHEAALTAGFPVTGTGAAKLVAFYTPP